MYVLLDAQARARSRWFRWERQVWQRAAAPPRRGYEAFDEIVQTVHVAAPLWVNPRARAGPVVEGLPYPWLDRGGAPQVDHLFSHRGVAGWLPCEWLTPGRRGAQRRRRVAHAVLRVGNEGARHPLTRQGQRNRSGLPVDGRLLECAKAPAEVDGHESQHSPPNPTASWAA